MTTRDQPPSGELLLVDYFQESSSGHYDTSRTVNLRAGKSGTIEMVEYKDECDQFKGPRTEVTTTWSVDREALIEFVRTAGKRVPN